MVRSTRGLLDIMFYVGMAITTATPLVFHHVGMYIEKFRTYYAVQCALYMASGVLVLLLVLELRRVSATVLTDDISVIESVAPLKRMEKCSFLIVVPFVLRLFVVFTPTTVVIIIVFSIAGLSCFALCLVFERAIRCKQENDLTIQTGRNDAGIVINLDMMMARRKKGLKELSAEVDITMTNLSILKNNGAEAIRFSTLEVTYKAPGCQPEDILSYEQEEGEDEDG